MQPFSVLMTLYKNDDGFNFQKALESLFNQSVNPTEVILVVDGPIGQDLLQVISNFQGKHKEIKVFFEKENRGHGTARRIALEKCNFDLVAVMDSDDICEKDRFESELKCFLQHQEMSVVGGQICEFDEDTMHLVGSRKVPLTHNSIAKMMKFRCPMNQMTVMFKKKDVLMAGGYLDWYCEEDYFLWIRMFLQGARFMNLPANLVYVRMNNGSYRRRGGWKYFKSETKLQIYMLKKGIITIPIFLINVFSRLIVEVIFPNELRKIFFNKILRSREVNHGN